MKAETTVVSMKVWGTWEELVLGGAVLRHGTRDWDAVASELRTRTLHPYTFTPEVCKAKYEDLQQRYSGCTAWFEELRKRRVAELKQALEQSEDSIGSLESKLETLRADKGEHYNVDYCSSPTEPSVPYQKYERVESSGKDISKDGLSAGSYTMVSAEEVEIKPEVSEFSDRETIREFSGGEKVLESSEQGKVSGIEKLAGPIFGAQMHGIRRRRGKRKRKNHTWDIKEGSVGESDIFASTEVTTTSRSKENSTEDCGQVARTSSVIDSNRDLSTPEIDDLMRIFDSVVKNENVTVFCHRIDSQKRVKYKKMIRRHMDFDTIRSRISNRSIMSAKELFRDMLLLANNALVFYPKKSHEGKCALFLRNLVTRALGQHCNDSSNKAATSIVSMTTMCNPPVRPRSTRPHNQKLTAKRTKNGNAVAGISRSSEKLSSGNSLSPVDTVPTKKILVPAKKGSSRQGRVGRGNAGKQSETLMKGRKRRRGR